jgi:hypothetical protein
LVEQKNQNQGRVCRYLLTDIGSSLLLTVQVTADNKIASIQMTQL